MCIRDRRSAVRPISGVGLSSVRREISLKYSLNKCMVWNFVCMIMRKESLPRSEVIYFSVKCSNGIICLCTYLDDKGQMVPF